MNGVHPELTKDRPKIYQIDVQGRLDESWSDYLQGMAITVEKGPDGLYVTKITGAVVDQGALHGVLNRIRDLNLPLLSVKLIGR